MKHTIALLAAVFLVGCATTFKNPETGEEVDPTLVTGWDDDGDGTPDRYTDAEGNPVTPETKLDADAAGGAATALAPFLGPFGPFVMPVVGLAPLIINRKD
jgi:hypothetical protein